MLNTHKAKSHVTKGDWFVILGLILLSVIPIIGGILRIDQLIRGPVTMDNSRFHASPIPVVMHIISVTIYSLGGAFQFSSSVRVRFKKWHRQIGKILIASGFVVAMTGLWMTLYYPVANFDGRVVFYSRLVVSIAMLLFLILGIDSIRRRDFVEHGNWMIRAYALGLGAGTQVLTHIPWFLFPEIQGELARSICMTLGWVLNVVAAEWIIQKMATNPTRGIS